MASKVGVFIILSVIAIFYLGIGICTIILGFPFIEACQNGLATWLFVYGVIFSSIFILIALTIISLPCLTKKSKMYYVVSRSLMTLFGLLFLFQLVWFIMGCVWIFRSDMYIDKKSKNQCPDFIYNFSISFLIILTIVNSFFICFIFGVKHSESMSEL